MKLWVDGQCFQTASITRGIGRYVVELLKSLVSHDVEIVVSLNGSLQQETVAARHYLMNIIPSVDIKIWYGACSIGENFTGFTAEQRLDQKILSAHIIDINPDIALSASPFEGGHEPVSPLLDVSGLANIKTACIFYDAIPYRFPEVYLAHKNEQNSYLRRFNQLDKFDSALCISDFTKNEYLDIFDKKECVSILAGISDEFQRLIDSWRYDEKSIGVSLGSYVVYVGGLDWRKNVPCLVKAMANLPQCRAGELKLVLVGNFNDAHVQPYRDIFDKYGISQEMMVITGYIADSELIDLYKHAKASVQPSRMEGFGLGALEAMACGTPFFSAYGGAVIEVVDNDGQMFDPDNYYELTKLLEMLITNERFKNEIIDHGYERVKEFSWEKTAAITMVEFERLLKDKVELTGELHPQPEIVKQSRLIMDVTSTSRTEDWTGIQRVMRNLSYNLLEHNNSLNTEVILSYSQNTKDWYQVLSLNKAAVQLSPVNTIKYKAGDSYLLLDSSWEFLDGQKQRLSEALVMGQEVVHGVYDIGPLTMPSMTLEHMPAIFRSWFELVLGYSTGIVCISKAVADELYQLIQAIKLPRPMKIGYFRLGADFSQVSSNARGFSLGKTRPTFLMVGTVEPRKGQYYGLKAFEKLWQKGIDVNLLIIGREGWNTRFLLNIIENHPEKDKRLFWREGVSDEELAASYEEADALIMTSFLEGFGLPVVEAGLYGTPVILSDIPVFQEVGKGAPKASYFTPGSVSSLADTVEHVVHNELHTDYASTEVNWPTWEDSAKELKQVVCNNKWYKYYKPEETIANLRFSDIGDITISHKLTNIEHELRVVEGPIISNDGTQLCLSIGVKNLSDELWSSNINLGTALGVSLGYHLYDSYGSCVSYDNPRSLIPFVLQAGQEIVMPIRVDTDILLKGVYSIGVELLQEGVRWFGNELSIGLLNPSLGTDPVLLDKYTDVKIEEPLGDADIEGELRLIHGPFLSQDGSHVRLEVGVKNLGSAVWSSNTNHPGGLGVNLSYHLYDEDGQQLPHEGARFFIPSIIAPLAEEVLQVTIKSDDLLDDAVAVGVELLQEGVRWFGNELLVDLSGSPVDKYAEPVDISDGYMQSPELTLWRGPFGSDIEIEQYFLFSVFNCDDSVLHYSNKGISNFSYSMIDIEGNETGQGVWAINTFDSIEAYNSGYLVLFANAKTIERSESLIITYQGVTWSVSFKDYSITKTIEVLKKESVDYDWLYKFDQTSTEISEVSLSFSVDSSLSLRGFNKLEGTHVWMSAVNGEVGLDTELTGNTLIKQIKIICSPYNELAEPIELSLLIGDELVSKKSLSHDFMEYIYDLDVEQNKKLIKNGYRISFLTNQSMQESGGERMLSVCFAKISLLVLTD